MVVKLNDFGRTSREDTHRQFTLAMGSLLGQPEFPDMRTKN